MAKSNSILDLQGTIAGMTHVNSKTYKKHVRKARSSGEVNEVFKKNNIQMADANKPAQLIKNAIDVYRQDFKGGQLWQALVSHFQRQLKEMKPFGVAELRGIEVNENYKLDKLFSGNANVSMEGGTLRLFLEYQHHPNFKRKFPDAYVFSAIVLFSDFANLQVEDDSVCSDVIPLDSVVEPLSFSFPVPENAGQYLVCLKLEAYSRGVTCEGNTTKGMKIVAAGDVVS